MRKTFIILLPLLLLIVFNVKGQGTDRRPNILWIVSEDNGPFLGCYGDRFATTPEIDRFASQAVLYKNAFSTSPVCAPARSTLITGMYANSLGTEHMRSTYPIPSIVQFFPRYLRKAGYYTSNNSKKDYNTIDQPEAWDESSNTATYKKRKPGQLFFSVFNLNVSHESSLHTKSERLKHDPQKVLLPPYHPETDAFRKDWAQYYDKIEAMDGQVGKILKQLDESGESENTIVFYFSDHGGVLGRSKRFIYESGLRVPLIIRFPKKYAHLASANAGSSIDRLVSFVDFAPTILSLAEIKIPSYLQGTAFLGKQQGRENKYALAYRGRMDERLDLVRSIRNRKYRYVRNYMPHKPYGQYIDYLWKAPSMRSWEEEYKAGRLNEVQSRFWKSKPVEELYDTENDPHNINNLADKKEFNSILKAMRKANRKMLLRIRDAGFIPEPMMLEISGRETLFEYTGSRNYPLKKILKVAETATLGDRKLLPLLQKQLKDPNPVIRYWALTGCTILGRDALPAKQQVIELLNDEQLAVRIASAEALYYIGEKEAVLNTLSEALSSDNAMARVQALNVLDIMGKDAMSILPLIQAIAQKSNVAGGEYDIRAATNLVNKYK